MESGDHQEREGVSDVVRPVPKRRTPIERYIEEGPIVLDRRRKYEEEQQKLGFIRCTVRVHKEDCAKVKAYAARLLKKRGGISD
jgi:hypothetical protein